MKAFVIKGPHSAAYEEAPDPQIAPDDVLLRVRAVAACGTDLEIYQGTMFYFTSGIAHYPIIPGHEWSGEVLEAGKNVRHIRPGDRVVGECTVACGQCEYCRMGWYNQCPDRRETGILKLNGGFAEKMCYPASWLHRFETLTFEEAALCETTAIAVCAVKLIETCPADYVAILGPGPVGLQAMQAARAYGARKVIMIGGRPSRRELALRLGADAAIDPGEGSLEAQVLSATDGHKFDVVIEATGDPAAIKGLMQIVRPRGRIALVGLFNSQKGELDLDPLVVNNITLKGSLGSPNVWEETVDLLEKGKIRAEPLISERKPLSQAAVVLQMMADKRPELIKAVLLP
jgi:2-desacetyl-2-hydroxyethyl bacteriochlorophyllide A dehydrogenase